MLADGRVDELQDAVQCPNLAAGVDRERLFERAPQLQFRPASVKQNDNVTDLLSTVALEPPTTSWPLDDDPGAKAALSWLGSQDSRLGPNPRTAYWLQDFAVVGTWLDIKNTISAVTYSSGNGFSQADFNSAKTELLKELGWVFKVRSYTTQLSTVFQQSGQPAWAQTHAIADSIYDSVKPPDNETTLGWFEFAEILLDLAGPLTDDASSEVAELLEFAVWAYGASASGAPTYDEFAVAAHQLGAQLEQLAMSTQEAVSRMGDVVVNDYAKLSLVGQNALCNPGPGCLEGWSFTGDDATQASADINRSIQRLAYEKVIPMAYTPSSSSHGTAPSGAFRPSTARRHRGTSRAITPFMADRSGPKRQGSRTPRCFRTSTRMVSTTGTTPSSSTFRTCGG